MARATCTPASGNISSWGWASVFLVRVLPSASVKVNFSPRATAAVSSFDNGAAALRPDTSCALSISPRSRTANGLGRLPSDTMVACSRAREMNSGSLVVSNASRNRVSRSTVAASALVGVPVARKPGLVLPDTLAAANILAKSARVLASCFSKTGAARVRVSALRNTISITFSARCFSVLASRGSPRNVSSSGAAIRGPAPLGFLVLLSRST